jgi:hypothetical protein
MRSGILFGTFASRVLKMPLTFTAIQHKMLRELRPPPGVLVLAGTGAALIGAGLILAWKHGTVVQLGDAILIALAWCL